MADRLAGSKILTDARWTWIADLLACPDCRGDLEASQKNGAARLVCGGCGSSFGSAAGNDVLDLRPSRPIAGVLTVRPGAGPYQELLDRLPKEPPRCTYDAALPPRATREFMSVLKDDVATGATVLEIGGGAGLYRAPALGIGLRFVTTDYDSPGADILADSHALPFKTGCADALVMQSVSQAFENPFVAFGEVARVVRNGGVVLGTADCCAVFAASFFNMTAWGLLSVLRSAGLAPERLWITKDALEFCGTNPGYPAVLKPVLRILSRVAHIPLLTPRNLLSGRPTDRFVTAGSFAFIARRSSDPGAPS